ncbi:hypothetical protein ACP70R_025646 [Stipagrostis hirtigluma subsp. patula]
MCHPSSHHLPPARLFPSSEYDSSPSRGLQRRSAGTASRVGGRSSNAGIPASRELSTLAAGLHNCRIDRRNNRAGAPTCSHARRSRRRWSGTQPPRWNTGHNRLDGVRVHVSSRSHCHRVHAAWKPNVDTPIPPRGRPPLHLSADRGCHTVSSSPASNASAGQREHARRRGRHACAGCATRRMSSVPDRLQGRRI